MKLLEAVANWHGKFAIGCYWSQTPILPMFVKEPNNP